MNRSNVEHGIYALLFQVAIGLPSGNWWAGAAFAMAWFLSREHAQREFQLTHGGSVKGLKPWAALDVWKWSQDRILDALVPAVIVLAVALTA